VVPVSRQYKAQGSFPVLVILMAAFVLPAVTTELRLPVLGVVESPPGVESVNANARAI